MSFIFNNNQIITERLILRPLTLEDTQDMFAYTSRPDATRFLSWHPHSHIEQTESFLKTVIATYGQVHTEFSWAIELKDKSKMIGVIKLFDINKNNKRAEVSYILNADYQGQGYLNEAIISVIDFAFKHMQLIRVQARCTTDNLASEKVMQKAGMLREGVLKKYWILKGETKDVVLYAITQ